MQLDIVDCINKTLVSEVKEKVAEYGVSWGQVISRIGLGRQILSAIFHILTFQFRP
jgi:hypothetical protein